MKETILNFSQGSVRVLVRVSLIKSVFKSLVKSVLIPLRLKVATTAAGAGIHKKVEIVKLKCNQHIYIKNKIVKN